MKRSGFSPKPDWKPLARGTSQLKRTPMRAGTVKLRAKKPAAEKPKRHAREQEDKHLADMCRRQACYLLIPGVSCTSRETVVPAHSNQLAHGKAKGMKAHHRYTVPGCHACHAELDQGMWLSRAEKFALWDDAYLRWAPVRTRLLAQKSGQIISHSADDCALAANAGIEKYQEIS